MKTLKNFLLFAVAMAALTTGAAAQNARKTDTLDAAKTFVNYRSTVFTATGRIGDAASCNLSRPAWELSLAAGRDMPIVRRNYNWNKGQNTNWSLHYTAATKQVTFKVAGEVLTYQLNTDKQINGLILKAWAPQCATVRLDNLVLSHQALGLKVKAQNCDQDFLAVRGLAPNQDFKLTGTANFAWQGEPKLNQMGFEIHGTEAVPEPATMTALGLGLAAMIRKRRNKKA